MPKIDDIYHGPIKYIPPHINTLNPVDNINRILEYGEYKLIK